MTGTTTHGSRNHQTLAAYEEIAHDYAASTRGAPSGVGAAGLRRLLAAVPEGGSVLELGSGPGWDADFVEEHGPRVRRTDATAAFCDLQTARGKQVERLDVVTDDYTDADHPAYDAVMALCLLLHVERADIDGVLRRVAAALRPGGTFLVSVREGSGECWETGDDGRRRYHVTLWTAAGFEERLRAAGLEPTWTARSLDGEGPWLTVIARTAAVSPEGGAA